MLKKTVIMNQIVRLLSSADDRPGTSWAPVYIGIRDAIVAHKIAPGSKLPEDEIASMDALVALINDKFGEGE